MLMAQIREVDGDLNRWESATAPHVEGIFNDPDGDPVQQVIIVFRDGSKTIFEQSH